MIKQLRKPRRIDQLKNDVRSATARPRHRGRLIYLGLLITFVLVLLDHFAGSIVFLRADGMVLKKRYVIAALYPARITEVLVREGQQVDKGTPLIRIESAEILRQIADISARNAELTAKLAQLKSRAAAVRSLLPVAEQNAMLAKQTMSSVERLKGHSLATSERVGRAYRGRLDSLSRVAELKAEAETVAQEMKLLEAARQEAQSALKRLQTFYNDGLVLSQVRGTVGPNIPSPGDVRNIGEDILSIYTGEAFVFAYLPDEYLFSVRPKQKVRVVSGPDRITGQVSEILPVADALPAEFQNIFKPRERSRLIRIMLPQTHPFAVSQKVLVRGKLLPDLSPTAQRLLADYARELAQQWQQMPAVLWARIRQIVRKVGWNLADYAKPIMRILQS